MGKGEGGSEALRRSRFYSECSGELRRALSRRVTGSDLCFSNLATLGREWIRVCGRESREPSGEARASLEESTGVMAWGVGGGGGR